MERWQKGEYKLAIARSMGCSANTIGAIIERQGGRNKVQTHTLVELRQKRERPNKIAPLPGAPGLFQSDAQARARLMAGR